MRGRRGSRPACTICAPRLQPTPSSLRWTRPRCARLLRRLSALRNQRSQRQPLRWSNPSINRNSPMSLLPTTNRNALTWPARSIIPTRARRAEASHEEQKEGDDVSLFIFCLYSLLTLDSFSYQRSRFDFLHNRRIDERCHVTEIRSVTFCDLAKDATHDLAGSRLRQAADKLNLVGLRDRSDQFGYCFANLLAELFLFVRLVVACHERINALSFEVVRIADHRRFANCRVFADSTFNFRRTEVVTGDDNDVVNASGNAVIAIFIAFAAVARKVFARECREIRLAESLVIAIDGARHCGPREFNG